MMPSIALSLILLGLALIAIGQLGMATHAFFSNPLKGLMCLVVPMYIVVHAKKTQAGKRLLMVWYIGLATLVIGGLMAS